MGKLLIYVGIGCIVVGVLVLAAEKIGLGKLPGDIIIRGERFTVYFPILTCILLSIVLSAVAWLIQWLRG